MCSYDDRRLIFFWGFGGAIVLMLIVASFSFGGAMCYFVCATLSIYIIGESSIWLIFLWVLRGIPRTKIDMETLSVSLAIVLIALGVQELGFASNLRGRRSRTSTLSNDLDEVFG